jgi:GT2 family glycosyltransferase
MLAVERNLTIGMSAYGNAGTTKEALDCLQRSVEGDYEAILVDDCSPDGGDVLRVFKDFKRHHPRTRIFRFDSNLEYSGSLNAILSHASGDEILFLSNDIYASPAYVRELLYVARSNPRFGIVRGCSNYVDNGKATHNVSPPVIKSFEEHLDFTEQIERKFHGLTLIDDYLVGDAFLIKRAVLERIGTLDPLFFGYFADTDLGLRTQVAGFDLVLARGAYAGHKRDANFHYLPPAERQTKHQRRWYRIIENWARFKMKYELPVDLLYTDPNVIPWQQLQMKFASGREKVKPGDYGAFELRS